MAVWPGEPQLRGAMCGDALPLAVPLAGGSRGWGGPNAFGWEVGEGLLCGLLVKEARVGPEIDGVDRGENCGGKSVRMCGGREGCG
jgi:hypothetical protein